ncbi:MAG TPA: FAD-dependent oxidoreductase [Candidatus Kryptonia bacterium]|nr:FAD-dependent oxidoreductase [Candidatus Kryptonia bacterium]
MAESNEAVVVGGGLGGLAAAIYLARAGRSVTLFEKSRALGGRAATQVENGFHFNLGPHALYRSGAGVKVLRELNVSFSGGVPTVAGSYAIAGGKRHTLPGGFVSLLTTSLFGIVGKLETARLLGAVQKIDAQAANSVTVRDWLDRSIRNREVRQLVQALFRVATYANDPDRQSAGAALEPFQMALADNVLYLHGGWQTLVAGLRAGAEAAGVEILGGTRATGVIHDRAVRGVRLADGTTHDAAAVIIAATPSDAAALVPDCHVVRRWADELAPVRAACLDVALSRLPQPQARFALGIDRPMYLSVHSAVAKLAPEAAATICVAKYLAPGASDSKADQQESERLLDLVQPGWRDVVVERRFLPNMLVSGALVTAAMGGVAGRPGPAVPGIEGLYVVGDWVGPTGQLADAALASAKQAAQLVGRAATSRAAA